jgi:uncharacterized protein YndB with AHSA1/START domain
MTDPAAATGHRLEIRRTFKASRERVFRAFTDPVELKKWFRAGDDYTTPRTEVELRTGGSYRWTMKSKEAGVEHTACGIYREITPPEKLVFTLDWEGDARMGVESLVTVELSEQAGGTEVVLTHEQLPSEEKRDAHEGGWIRCLEQLEKLLKS